MNKTGTFRSFLLIDEMYSDVISENVFVSLFLITKRLRQPIPHNRRRESILSCLALLWTQLRFIALTLRLPHHGE